MIIVIMILEEERNLAKTKTSAVMEWRWELAYEAADLSSFNRQIRASFGNISTKPCQQINIILSDEHKLSISSKKEVTYTYCR